jgi:rfaE bifunctional protein kinase chain/domain
MKYNDVGQLVSKIKNVTVAVYGDFCLDAYWILDPKGGEISVETGLKTHAAAKHYYSLGGASNVVANLAALEPKKISAIGVVGDDIFGRELRSQMQALKVDTAGLVIQKEHFDTVTFGKPYIEAVEQPRIDFGFFNNRTAETENALLESINNALLNCDVLIFNQQVPGSLSEMFISKVNNLFKKHSKKIVMLDSRHYGKQFENVFRKTNAVEAATLCGVEARPGDVIPLADTQKYAKMLFEKAQKPVFITRGPRGIIAADKAGLSMIPGIQILKKTDPVGCGDTTTSAIALALAAGYCPADAAQFANFAAAVTAQKLFQTGTANAAEIMAVARDTDYIYQPELADDPRQAKYVPGTDIELTVESSSLEFGHIKHAVFDHDGTISTLRQGWEAIMEPVMIKAILGDQYATADEKLYHRVRSRVRDFIDKSTGIETIIQMVGLIEMVQEFGVVPKDKILDKFGYKKIYNDALMIMVNDRIARFNNGELDINDYTVKNSVSFLRFLKSKGVRLYLASGTDLDDVINEAKVLGYADLFDGGIYGSVGDSNKMSKKMVIEKIITTNNLRGSELIVTGDGPVEMRESIKRDGLALGIASDEVRRHGMNLEKRTRLIKAGAQIIIPDFSQFEQITKLLFPNG